MHTHTHAHTHTHTRCPHLHAGVADRVRRRMVMRRRQIVHIVRIAISRILPAPLPLGRGGRYARVRCGIV